MRGANRDADYAAELRGVREAQQPAIALHKAILAEGLLGKIPPVSNQ